MFLIGPRIPHSAPYSVVLESAVSHSTVGGRRWATVGATVRVMVADRERVDHGGSQEDGGRGLTIGGGIAIRAWLW